MDWLTQRYHSDSARFAVLLGEGPFFHGAQPGIGDCAIWGYTQWQAEAGVAPTTIMADWLARMRALPEMVPPSAMFPQA